MRLDEEAIPVKPAVEAACELLGLDPLYVANEGKLDLCVRRARRRTRRSTSCTRTRSAGDAAIIGEVVEDEHGFVQMQTGFRR
jgi:hydrogenase expression/formation protein HypE